MRISVVIPVYNAARFVKTATESALDQEQTVQVVLVEDGSIDGSLEVCRQLESQYAPVQLFRHPDGGNHGAGASRNLGIQKSIAPYVAFLDADDFYLKKRFDLSQELLESDQSIDGVFESIGVYFQDELSRKKWADTDLTELTTMSKRISPEKLFDTLVDFSAGYFSLDGLVVRKSAFWKEAPFYRELRLHQDTAFNIQLSYYARLVPGRLAEPVTMRRVHGGNRYISSTSIYRTRMKLWETLFKWSLRENLAKNRIANVFRNALYFRLLLATGRFSGNPPRPLAFAGLFSRAGCHPRLFLQAMKEHRRRRGL